MTRHRTRLLVVAAITVAAAMMRPRARPGRAGPAASRTPRPRSSGAQPAHLVGSDHEPHRERHQHDHPGLRVADPARREGQRRAEPRRVLGVQRDDGTAVTFTLRDGLTFSDGEPLDAEAVKAFLDRGKTQEDSLLKDQLADLESVTADSDLDVTLHLAEADYQIPYLVAGRTGAIASPTAAEDPAAARDRSRGRRPIHDHRVRRRGARDFEKNPDYWDADNIHIDKLNLKPSARMPRLSSPRSSPVPSTSPTLPATQAEEAEARRARCHGGNRR